jgi:hypothetical protein
LVNSAVELPESPYYLIHPALDSFIRSQRTQQPFLQFQLIPVGENIVWEPYFPTLIQIEKQLVRIDDRRFVDLAHQVVKRVRSSLNSGKTPFARLEIESHIDWKTLWGYENKEDCYEVLLWLEELLDEL